MCPPPPPLLLLQLLLPLLLLLSAVTAESTQPEHSTGLKFIVAFPENIAFYHPSKADNKVQITALHDNTEVTIKMYNYSGRTYTLAAGETREFDINKKMELQRLEISNKTIQITGTKEITVHAINLKSSSVQTALVIPTDKLATEYLVPPVPTIQGTTVPAAIVTTDVAERGPFKLVIVNTDKENEVTVEGTVSKDISLQPHQVAQIWVKADEGLRTVKAEQPVAVLFGHTCAMRHNCTCGQLYATLPPAKEEKLRFYIPPVLAKDVETESFVLLSEKESTKVEVFDKDSPLVETTGSAIFYRPGLLLTLIPETDFASCYVVNSITDTQSFAVIVVHKDHTDEVHVKSLPLENPEWQELKGTEYVTTHVPLATGKSVIWHASSKMAVYFVGLVKDGAMFGNPAPIISKIPDFRGCVLSPEVVEIGQVADGWRESLKYCRDKSLELVSFPEARFQRQIYDKIHQANNETLREAWIGMRRRSQSGEFYWLNGKPVSHTNWEEAEPGTVHDGQCVIMSLKKSKDFGWSDKGCCEAAHPICYRKPVFLPID